MTRLTNMTKEKLPPYNCTGIAHMYLQVGENDFILLAKGDAKAMRGELHAHHKLMRPVFIKHPNGSYEEVEDLKRPTCSTCVHHSSQGHWGTCSNPEAANQVGVDNQHFYTSSNFGCIHHQPA